MQSIVYTVIKKKEERRKEGNTNLIYYDLIEVQKQSMHTIYLKLKVTHN